MKLHKKDWLFAAALAALLGLLLLNTTRKKPAMVPADDRHRPLLERLARGTERAVVERECAVCHKTLSTKHPPKEQCLLCHGRKG